MSIDLSRVTGISDSRGVITEIKDSLGRVIWAMQSGTKSVLQVKKGTYDTYAGETKYTGEVFIALDIYPKKNGSVKVTYGGLTKTIKDTSGAETPNAQTVYFGTLYGVTDSVTTPASGTLTIEGQFYAFGCGAFVKEYKLGTAQFGYCSCITGISEWGEVTKIPNHAFNGCTNLALTSLPSGITSIGQYAFSRCTKLALTTLPSGLSGELGQYVFNGCTNLALTSLPSGITSIGQYAFSRCTNLALVSLSNSLTSIGFRAFEECTKISLTALPNGVKTVDSYAFYKCSGIKSLAIPASVELLDTYSLNCVDANGYLYTAFRFLGTTPPLIRDPESTSYSAFGGLNLRLYGGITVPKGCGEAYKTAEVWSSYASYIVEAS